MPTIHEILKQYWRFSLFREKQEEIINSILNGNDTLALLPTGGGKSICFQVPAMAKDGICIVISPLIALMKDQVENLQRKNIKAIAINSTMHYKEIDIALDNCVHGNIKFLYLSPERLETEIVKARLKKMNINLLAVDEAHCISQWGYDFRPSYLKIAALRELLPKVPVLALTATATPEVVKDIQEKLLFKKVNVIQKSFERKNLSYVVLHEEDKLQRLIKIAERVKGSGIVYVRNRKKTQEIAAYLKSNNIPSDYYHAGLDALKRGKKQNDWIENKTRIIVATNAFGMGIDKPDVRFVVHIDLPDTIEAYFQEAGRAGRDGKKAYAILLFNHSDEVELKTTIENSFPPIEEIKKTYQALANYYQIPSGSGEGSVHTFDIAKLCDTYNLKAITVFNSLKFIEREGYISLSDAIYQPTRIKLEMNREDLYKFQLSNPNTDAFIKTLLRSYSGLFDSFIKINEFDIAKKANLKKEDVMKRLSYLQQSNVLTYLPQTELPQLTFTKERIDVNNFALSKENYSMLKKKAIEKMESVLNYANSRHTCRSKMLLSYFGEMDVERCNQCDVCLEENRKILHTDDFEDISKQLKQLLAVHSMELKKLVNAVIGHNEEKVLRSIQLLIDDEVLQQKNNEISIK